MSKTIMIADETYSKLKKMKEARKMSFTQMINSIMRPDDNAERNRQLLALRGSCKFDPKEEERTKKLIKEGWRKWNEKYA